MFNIEIYRENFFPKNYIANSIPVSQGVYNFQSSNIPVYENCLNTIREIIMQVL